MQLTGQSGGLITGSVGAVDPEQEQVSYSLTQAPKYGSVVIASDGTFTYTPGRTSPVSTASTWPLPTVVGT